MKPQNQCRQFLAIFIIMILALLGVSQAADQDDYFSGIRPSSSENRIVLPQWQYLPGPLNAITDVPGVSVGHVTIRQDKPVTIRTGVTAIMPHPHDLATLGLWADGLMLNGNGELTGLGPLQTSGILNSPIMLSNTYSVGAVHTGVFSYFLKHYPGETRGSTRWPGLLPVIGECYDGVFNTIEALNTIQPETAVRALESARSDRVLQGRVGAGTGMRSFELHAGIGTASRQVTLNRENYTVGVLVNANHSRFNTMNPIVRQALEQKLGRSLEALKQQDDQDRVHRESTKPQRQGSIIVVIATNAPLIPTQLRQLALRAGLGIGAMGSTMDTTSGDGVIAFSTATPIHLDSDPPASIPQEPVLHPDALSPFYRAVVEAVTEAQINAIWASHSPSLEGGQF